MGRGRSAHLREAKRVDHVRKLGWAVFCREGDADYVKTKVSRLRLLALKIELSSPGYSGAFVSIDGLEWVAAFCPGSRPDLDKNAGAILDGNDVEFALGAPPIPRNYPQAPLLKVHCRKFLCPIAQ